MDKRFLTIWATASISCSALAIGTSKPFEMSIAAAGIGLALALFDSKFIRS